MTTTDLPLDGGTIHVVDDGPRDAPALLLVHGFAASTRSWDALVPLLAGSYRVIRMDLLGHGRSATPENAGYEIADQAGRAAAVLDRLAIDRAVVVGHSTGGMVATALAEERPDLVRALVLVDTGPGLAALIAPPLALDPDQWAQVTDEQIRAAMAPAFSRPGFEIPQTMVDDVRGMTLHALGTTQQASHRYLERRTVPGRLRGLGLPLLVIFGADDHRWAPSSAADYRVVPGARVELLPGLGHSPIVEDPEATAGLVLPFVAAVA